MLGGEMTQQTEYGNYVVCPCSDDTRSEAVWGHGDPQVRYVGCVGLTPASVFAREGVLDDVPNLLFYPAQFSGMLFHRSPANLLADASTMFPVREVPSYTWCSGESALALEASHSAESEDIPVDTVVRFPPKTTRLVRVRVVARQRAVFRPVDSHWHTKG